MILLACIVPAMLALAGFAYARIAPDRRAVPMQWSLSGNVNWSAPRALAFASIPMLAIALMAVLAVTGAGHARDIGIVGMLLFACQAMHIGLVSRWSKRKRG
ncbi:hypothetical protein ASC97_01580 [Rhizobium sp. Root1203]|uniref:hypothetical protein n=1 Tax=Rhizobium sp. Root1203 TaxID=1736427 RepID=UPI00070C4575|nr:hypothetical protein [Rhizobium sp. Root1203]KQV32313.1 hypothetical protein ASC97_01580 [Rhizobium sp. Root1203]